MKKYILIIFIFWGFSVFSQTDTSCINTSGTSRVTKNYLVFGAPANASYSQYSSSFTIGTPISSARTMISSGYQSNLGIWSPFMYSPRPQSITASQGDYSDKIVVSWQTSLLEPNTTGFILKKDGATVGVIEPDAREYIDNAVQAGDFHTYSIACKNSYGTGLESSALGFVNPNGIVSGRITTQSTNPVPGVEVRLTPVSGSSILFDGVDDQLCIDYANKFNATNSFTVSAYVKFGQINNEAGIIDFGSTLNKNFWITTTSSSKGKGYVFYIGNGTSSTSLEYIIPVNASNNLGNDTKWHQITMTYNGSAMSVMVDGNFVGTKLATLSKEKQRLTIGSKINGSYFKGWIDDIRIYNRSLTQTEVNATKNRSIAKTENGLVGYWKMDEGTGAKVFDYSNTPTNGKINGGASFATDIPEIYNTGVSNVNGNYSITGVNYSTVQSFRVIPFKNIDFNSSLEFSASNSSFVDLKDFAIPDTSTIELLFYPFDLNTRQTILSKGNLLNIYIENSSLFVNLNGIIKNLGTIQQKNNHIAITLLNNSDSKGSAKASFFLNGNSILNNTSYSGISNWANTTSWLLGSNLTDANGKFYTGIIDEFAIYKTALPQNIIQVHANTGIQQDETSKDLFSYFDFNEGDGFAVFDYAAVNAGLSQPRAGAISRATWSNNVKNPKTSSHEFLPSERVVNLNSSNSAVGNVDFTDKSTINVSGYARYANTICFEDSVEILNNGQPLSPPVITDEAGKWSADFEPGANIKLSAKYKKHTFNPGFVQFNKLSTPKAGIVFLDITKRTIFGQIAGGDCRKSIIPQANGNNPGAFAVVKITATDGCFFKTDTVRSADGRYVFRDLPAKNFTVSVVQHSVSNIYTYFQNKGGQTIDLRNKDSLVVDFIYYDKPQVEITAKTPNPCVQAKLAGQGVLDSITVKVYENYFGQKCYVTGAKLHIDDATSGTSGDTTLATNVDTFKYYFVPRNVNIISPYKQVISVTATHNTSSALAITDFVVLGQKGVGKSFTASTPEMPDFILRDPPGDGSYAVLKSGSTICNNRKIVTEEKLTTEHEITYNFGSLYWLGIGQLMKVESTVEITAKIGDRTTWKQTSLLNTCITTKKEILTDNKEKVVGSLAGGDVYVGRSQNVTFGESKILNFSLDSCKLYIVPSIQIDSIRTKTEFQHSENFIVNSLLPNLKLLSEQSSNTNKTIDSVSYITWKRIIELNKSDKSGAPIKTISFDAGTRLDYIEESKETQSDVDYFEGAGFFELASKAEVDLGGTGWKRNNKIRFIGSKTTESETQNEGTFSVTYHLEDNDNGDGYQINVYKGKKYNTWIFETVAGQSSCPWEKGTKPRAEPFVRSVDGTERVNVPRNTPAVYKIEIANNSPSKEAQYYFLFTKPGTNYANAVLKADGKTFSSFAYQFYLQYGEKKSLNVTLEKGTVDTNNINVKLKLQSQCEYDAWLALPTGGGDYAKSLYGGNWSDSLFVRYLDISAQFVEACSPVDIGFPLKDWVVTPASQNNLRITLNNYRKDDSKLKLLRVQYRPIGGDGSWIDIQTLNKADLGDIFTDVIWNTSLIQDGPYEIRSIAECNDINVGLSYSATIPGLIQRSPPTILGSPQPADGVWDPGDEISVTFTKDINCNKVVQADVLANNTIGLYDATTGKLVDATISCLGNKITIVPNINKKFFENHTFRIQLTGKDYDDAQLAINPNHQSIGIMDMFGNEMAKSVNIEFFVNQNSLEWIGTDVHAANTVNQPFSVTRQIRNRGGQILNFNLKNTNAWLTTSPNSGTISPGQTKDVTLTFQQDMLIGDYLDTLNLVGPEGTEPLLIDFKVRCPSPNWVVNNPTQYGSTMNMVVGLNIFGENSADPSDKIALKIGGVIRGIGNITYYPALKKWFAFVTVYGNPIDNGKNLEFSIWDGSKCLEYTDVVEQIAFQGGNIVGTPLEPQMINVLNVISRKIPLNQGWNSVSFNLNLGANNNTVSNVLNSLKNKSGILIKDVEGFSKSYGNIGSITDWRGSLSSIIPQKRYMIYVPQIDTLTIKGSPYKSKDYPINLVQGWNWIGFIPSAGQALNTALKGLTPLNGDIIKSQNSFSQYAAGNGWIGNLNFMEPSRGYLLNISNAGTLTYPDPISSGRMASTSETNETESFELNFPLSQFSDKNIDTASVIIYSKKDVEINSTVNLKSGDSGISTEQPFGNKSARNANSTVTINIKNQLITVPTTIFQTVSIPNSVTPTNANCTTYSFKTILPTGSETAPACVSAVGLEGNMTGVVKVKYNELSNFSKSQDVLTFINPADNKVVGCGQFDNKLKVFNVVVSGTTAAFEIPIDVKYYSDSLHKTFMIKSAFKYSNNNQLGDHNSPYEIDMSPLLVSLDNLGQMTAVLKDDAWIGQYCVDVFAKNCSGYDDGQTSLCFQRTNSTITATGTLSALNTTYGTASSSTNFTVSGSNLSDNISVTAPTGFEISVDGNTYSSTKSLVQTDGQIPSTTIYVRLKEDASVINSPYSGNIELTSSVTQTVYISTLASTVNPKNLTVTGISAINKIYDGNTDAKVSGGALNGVIFSDEVTVSGNGVFASPNVDTNIPITTTLVLGGAKASNYTLTQPTDLVANITAVTLRITGITINNKTYDGTSTATMSGTASLLVVIDNDDVSLSGTPTITFNDKNVGEDKPVIISGFSLTGSTSNNYALVLPANLKANITPDTLKITGISISNKTYDGTTSATISGNPALHKVIGDDDVSLAGEANVTFVDKNAGKDKSVIISGFSLTGTSANNYVLSAQTDSVASIIPDTLKIIGISIKNKTYDGTTTAMITGNPTLDGLIGDDDVSLAGEANVTFIDKNAEKDKTLIIAGLRLTGTSANNYMLSAQTDSVASIIPDTLKITGISIKNKTYDGTTSATISGNPALYKVIGDDDVSLAGEANVTFIDKNTGKDKPVIIAGLNLTGASVNNYVLSAQTDSVASIIPDTLKITGISIKNKTYDGTTSAIISGNPTLHTVRGDDDVSLAGEANIIFIDKNAGKDKTLIIAGLSLTGASANNYVLSAQTDSVASIIPDTLTLDAAVAQNKKFDGTTDAIITGTLKGVIPPDNVTFNGVGTFASSAVGNAISVTPNITLGGTDANNYTLTQPTGLTANITADTLKITGITINNKIYDGIVNATISGTASLSGVNGDDVVSLAGTPTITFNDKNVGKDKVVTISGYSLTGVHAGKYVLSQPTGLLASISPATLTLDSATAQNKKFDGTTDAIISGKLKGVISPDTITFNGTGTFASSGVGNNIAVTPNITLGGKDANNYTLTQPTGLTANILPLPSVTEIIFPQYAIYALGANYTKNLPYVCRLKLDNLSPNKTYRYVIGDFFGGIGESMYAINNISGPYGFITGFNLNSSLSGTLIDKDQFITNSQKGYAQFTTDSTGTYEGWFAQLAEKRRTDNHVTINLNDGANGTSVITTLTTTLTYKNLDPSVGTNGANAIRGNSTANPEEMIFLYDNTAGNGRPIYGTWAENDGSTTIYTDWYNTTDPSTSVDGVNGAWGAYIPVDLPNGIRRIERRETATGNLIGCPSVDDDGIWASGANTVNPPGGTSPIVISISDAPLSCCPDKLVLASTTDDISSGTMLKQASKINGNIKATNIIQGTANVLYQSQSVDLGHGFKADNGTVFKVEIGGCL